MFSYPVAAHKSREVRSGLVEVETSIAEDIGATKVLASKHFGHSKVCESKPGLSGSIIRNDIGSPHFEQRGLLILATNIAHSPY